MNKIEYVIVVGCGRLGSHLANLLSKGGKSVVVLDINEEAFENLSQDFSGFTIPADGSEIDALERAKIFNADVVVSTTNDDSTNIMIAQIAKKIFGVKGVIAKVIDPGKINVYKALEIDYISPTILSAQALNDIIMEQ